MEKIDKYMNNWAELGYELVDFTVVKSIFGVVKGYVAIMERIRE